MKKFDNLNIEENKIKESLKENTEREKNISILPIAMILIAVIFLVALCIHLFGKKPVNTRSESKAYEVEIDGKTYSADTLEDLNKLVGFDVSLNLIETYDVGNAPERTTL